MIQVDPATIVVYADVGCPWAHLAVHRLHRARAEAGLADRVRFDIRPFPLEIFNRQPTPKLILDAEVPVAGALDAEAGWRMWQRPPFEYPVTMLPAMEAVETAKEQGLEVSEELDRALRVAFFGESRVISLRHVIEEVASECALLEENKLMDALDEGRARPAMMEHVRRAGSDEVDGSPHLFLPDGTSEHNPGIEMHWEGDHGKGFPVVDRDRPDIYRELLQRAAAD